MRIPQFICDGCHQESPGGRRIFVRAFRAFFWSLRTNYLNVPVAHAGHYLLRNAVIPVVRNDAADSGHSAAHEYAVAHSRFGWGLQVMGVGEIRSVAQQAVEAAMIIRAEPSQIVVAELIDDNTDDKFGLLRRLSRDER